MAGCSNCMVGCPKCNSTIAAFLRERRMDSRGMDRGYEISAAYSGCWVEAVSGDLPEPVTARQFQPQQPDAEQRERLLLRVAVQRAFLP